MSLGCACGSGAEGLRRDVRVSQRTRTVSGSPNSRSGLEPNGLAEAQSVRMPGPWVVDGVTRPSVLSVGRGDDFEGFYRREVEWARRLAFVLVAEVETANHIAHKGFMRLHRRYDKLENSRAYLRVSQVEKPVIVPPQHAARFDVTWTAYRGVGTCPNNEIPPTAAFVRIPVNGSQAVTRSAQSANGGPPIEACGGSLSVSFVYAVG